MLGVDSSPGRTSYSSSEYPTCLNMQSKEEVITNDVLASDYGGYKMTGLNYMNIWLGGVVC